MKLARSVALIGLLTLLGTACNFSPTAPFSGFDEKGSRVTGRFGTEADSAAQFNALAKGDARAKGIRVSIQSQPSITVEVGSNGTFTLTDVPAGSFVLVFQRDGQVLAEVLISNVRKNQNVTIVVMLLDGEVVLIDEDRDQVSFEDECPRGAGFWCQNKGGKNPNLSAEEFEEFSTKAAELFAALPALDTPEEVSAAVCNTGNQLLRHLATLGLNIASETIELDTPLTDSTYATVGAAFEAAIAAAAAGTSNNTVKDVIEAINDNENHEACDEEIEDDDDVPTVEGKVTICHIPPGNPSKKKTITVGAAAWPAHERHGDTLGACAN
jgi:hypothetical protein